MPQITVADAKASIAHLQAPGLGDLMIALGARTGVTPRQVRAVWRQMQGPRSRREYAPGVRALAPEEAAKAAPHSYWINPRRKRGGR